MKHNYIFLLFTIYMLTFFSSQAQEVWIGDDITFTKEGSADWTLEGNQDRITENVWLTRQNSKAIYNYKWWQDNFSTDATTDDIYFNFWNDEYYPPAQSFTPSGGTQGIRWALLDDTGSTSDWSGYKFGELGDSTNFYSLNNIMEIIKILEGYPGDFSTIDVLDDFSVSYDGYIYDVPDVGDYIVGKKFGLWLKEDDVYLTLTFDSWGNGNQGAGFSYTRTTDALLNSKQQIVSQEIKIAPNPTSNFIQVKGLIRKSEYKIYNVLGVIVGIGEISSNEQIDVQNLDSGLYFIHFEDGETKRFIKE